MISISFLIRTFVNTHFIVLLVIILLQIIIVIAVPVK